MAAKDFQVAIELGSSKMTGIVGNKNPDGSINVLAVVQEDSSSFIQKGVVYNLDKTAQALTNIVNRLMSIMHTEITQVYVGIGGQSIHSVLNVITRDMDPDTKVTQDMVIEQMDTNRTMIYPDQEILDVAQQEFKVDQQLQLDPVGIPCKHLEGRFVNILARKSFYKNLNDCFETAGITVPEFFLSPLALADSVLSEAEKRSGCLLVDLGAATTTVCVFSKYILGHLAVLPLGSKNITKDIASLQIDEVDAEKLKLKHASAWTDAADINDEISYAIDESSSINSAQFIEVVEARLMEIIANVWAQVPAEYCDNLLGGIILTGGGSNMKNIIKAFTNKTQVEKIRIAEYVNHTITSNIPEANAHNGMMNTVLGLLVKGNENCAGGEYKGGPTLFADRKDNNDDDRPVRKVTELQPGVVQTMQEKERAEKEAAERLAEQKRQEELERQKEAQRQAELEREEKLEREEEKRRRAEEEKRNQESLFSKWGKRLKSFTKQLGEEE